MSSPPKPWVCVPHKDGSYSLQSASLNDDGDYVASVFEKVDAQLLVAAPDLLEALQAFVEFETEIAENSFKQWDSELKVDVWNDDVWRKADPEGFPLIVAARAAIAKASGQ